MALPDRLPGQGPRFDVLSICLDEMDPALVGKLGSYLTDYNNWVSTGDRSPANHHRIVQTERDFEMHGLGNCLQTIRSYADNLPEDIKARIYPQEDQHQTA